MNIDDCDVDDAVGASESHSSRIRLFHKITVLHQVHSASTDHHAGHHLLYGRLSAAALHRPVHHQRRQGLAVAGQPRPSHTTRQDLSVDEGGRRVRDGQLRRELYSVLRQRLGVQTGSSKTVSVSTSAAAAAPWRHIRGRNEIAR